MLEQHQALPGRQQDQQADQQPAGNAGPEFVGTRIRQHQPGRHTPPQDRRTQHPRRQLRHEVEQHQQPGHHGGKGNTYSLRHQARQARPLPGTEGDHQTDEQGEIATIEQEEATQSDRQQDQRSDDALFKH
ncbi:hypothetical protein D9M71_536860 [compost metagenome]